MSGLGWTLCEVSRQSILAPTQGVTTSGMLQPSIDLTHHDDFNGRMDYATLPWWRKDGTDGVALESAMRPRLPIDADAVQRHQCRIMHVVTSNLQEGTLPLSTSAHQAMLILSTPSRGMPRAPSWADPSWADASWADASWADASAAAQLNAHMAALDHLMAHDSLSVQLLTDTHAILMEGAKLEDSGAPVPRGQLRTQPVHANGRLFMDAARVPAALISACSIAAIREPNQELCVHIARAARLFRDVVHDIHPFMDGNGRLGRLLIAWCLLPQVGIVLPVINGHRKPRKKYEAFISRMARTLGDSAAPMRSHILECLAYRVCCLQRSSTEINRG